MSEAYCTVICEARIKLVICGKIPTPYGLLIVRSCAIQNALGNIIYLLQCINFL